METACALPTILLRVLVADSGSSVNDSLTAFLSDFDGLSVFGCSQEATKVLALVETVKPDVVILDLQMAGPIGLRVLKQIKRLPSAPIVIVLSGYNDPRLCLAAVAARADHWLVKTDCEQLQSVLGTLVQQQRFRTLRIGRHPSGGANGHDE